MEICDIINETEEGYVLVQRARGGSRHSRFHLSCTGWEVLSARAQAFPVLKPGLRLQMTCLVSWSQNNISWLQKAMPSGRAPCCRSLLGEDRVGVTWEVAGLD